MVDYREGVYLPSNEQLKSSCHPKCVNCNPPVIIVNHRENVYLSFNEHMLDKEYANCTCNICVPRNERIHELHSMEFECYSLHVNE